VFPNYTFDMSDYKNTHCKIISTCDKGHTSLQSVKNLLNGHVVIFVVINRLLKNKNLILMMC